MPPTRSEASSGIRAKAICSTTLRASAHITTSRSCSWKAGAHSGRRGPAVLLCAARAIRLLAAQGRPPCQPRHAPAVLGDPEQAHGGSGHRHGADHRPCGQDRRHSSALQAYRGLPARPLGAQERIRPQRTRNARTRAGISHSRERQAGAGVLECRRTEDRRRRTGELLPNSLLESETPGRSAGNFRRQADIRDSPTDSKCWKSASPGTKPRCRIRERFRTAGAAVPSRDECGLRN